MCSGNELGQRENHLPPGFHLCSWGGGKEKSLIHFNQRPQWLVGTGEGFR